MEKGFPNQPRLVISDAVVQDNGLVWLFSNNGLIYFDPDNTNDIRSYSLPQPHQQVIMSGAKFEHDHLLISGRNSGLWLFDLDQKKFTDHFPHEEDLAGSLSTNDIGGIYLDPQHHIWASSFYNSEVNEGWAYHNSFTNPFFQGDQDGT